ncbi:MAG: hypothetical protein GTO24_15665 [candidate division Zixibacteria bacterium]|nr:hypothetical protein [candidate division Zixibacteria bacterium]
MPNWCFNDLYVSGDSEALDRFKDFAKDKDDPENVLHTDNFIPYPEHFKKMDEEAERERKKGNHDVKDGFNNGGYDWCCENWGTKWGICDPRIENADDWIIRYSFDTAWSPPKPLIVKMSEMFPKLIFELKYEEPNDGLYGLFIVEGGEIVTDKSMG